MLAGVKQELFMRLPQLATYGGGFDELGSCPDNGNDLHLAQICIAPPIEMSVPPNLSGKSGTANFFP
jgi:hypothetical protein